MHTKYDNDLKIQWNFFEGNYGKGAVDGVVGTVKHAVYDNMSGYVVLEVSKQFAEYSGTKTRNIHVIYLPAN